MSRKQKERVRLTALNIFFIVLCFITLIPILYSISVSLNGQNTLLSSDFSFIPKNFSLENYRRVLFGEDILTWLGNSVYLAVVTVSLSLCVAIPAAYCFSRRRFPGRRPILKCLVLLNSFPAVLSMFAVYRLLRPMGLINHRTGLILGPWRSSAFGISRAILTRYPWKSKKLPGWTVRILFRWSRELFCLWRSPVSLSQL